MDYWASSHTVNDLAAIQRRLIVNSKLSAGTTQYAKRYGNFVCISHRQRAKVQLHLRTEYANLLSTCNPSVPEKISVWICCIQ